VLHQEGQDLHIHAQGYSGYVVVEGFFNHDRFLNLSLSPYNPNAQYGSAGDDVMQGTSGNDILYGNPGNDQLYGGAGNDFLHGGDGDDLLEGGPGDDVLQGGRGNDTLKGGVGRDHYHTSPGTDLFVDDGGWDTYVIHWDSLWEGGITTIQDNDGFGDLLFDGTYLHEVNMTATGINTWSVQGQHAKGLLTRQGLDLHIQAENAAGLVVVEDFFSVPDFLNLALPEFVLPLPMVQWGDGVG